MRFLLDECLPHSFVERLAVRGYADAVHPIHIGLRGHRDDQIVSRALADDRIIITTNAADYRKLLARETVHPGCIIPEALEREPLWSLIEVAFAFIELHPDPAGYMVNRVIEVSATDGVRPYELAKGEQAQGAIGSASALGRAVLRRLRVPRVRRCNTTLSRLLHPTAHPGSIA